MWDHLSDRHDEPERGDEITLINDLGLPNGKVSRVKAIRSEDKREELFEIVDNFNAVRIVTRLTDTTWIEVFLEEA